MEHGIRGAESREDARFASDLCERLNIPCHVHSVDVPQYAKVMDSDWRRPPGYCAMKRLKGKSPLPMQQTKSRVTAGR